MVEPLILPKDSASATLAIYTKYRIPVDTKICTLVFIAALFILVKMQPRFPSIGDWISKLYYTQTLLEEVAMARVNIDILGIRELKWTRMG